MSTAQPELPNIGIPDTLPYGRPSGGKLPGVLGGVVPGQAIPSGEAEAFLHLEFRAAEFGGGGGSRKEGVPQVGSGDSIGGTGRGCCRYRGKKHTIEGGYGRAVSEGSIAALSVRSANGQGGRYDSIGGSSSMLETWRMLWRT